MDENARRYWRADSVDATVQEMADWKHRAEGAELEAARLKVAIEALHNTMRTQDKLAALSG